MKLLIYLLFFLAFLGLLDAGFLTYEHYSNALPPCSTHLQLIDCESVLRSTYATIAGIPVALFGMFDYAFFLGWIILYTIQQKSIWLKLFTAQAAIGFLVSLALIYLQIGIIKSICLYCMGSALLSILIFFTSLFWLYSSGKLPATSD